MRYSVEPVGHVQTTRAQARDDFWGNEESSIALVPSLPAESLAGLAEFSHAEIIYLLHKVEEDEIVSGARHPRDNPDWPLVGIFAQRGKSRPNRIGSTICRVLRVEGASLVAAELDAIDGTPVLDIKPVMQEFLPRGAVRQLAWSHELMAKYWLDGNRA